MSHYGRPDYIATVLQGGDLVAKVAASATAVPAGWRIEMPHTSDQSSQARSRNREEVTLFLAGDVMTGRGVDQILPHPGDPHIFEPAVRSATDYVALAEAANGPVAKPVAFDYVWGDALTELGHRRPNARLVNLETAVTAA